MFYAMNKASENERLSMVKPTNLLMNARTQAPRKHLYVSRERQETGTKKQSNTEIRSVGNKLIQIQALPSAIVMHQFFYGTP